MAVSLACAVVVGVVGCLVLSCSVLQFEFSFALLRLSETVSPRSLQRSSIPQVLAL